MLAAVVLCALSGPSVGGGPIFAGVAARDPSLDAQAERAAIALGQVLEKKGATDLGSPPLPDAIEGVDAILAGLVTAAKAKYSEGDFAAAADKAADAITRFEGAGAFRAGPAWAGYGDALVVKALALRRLGKEADADQALLALASTMPKAIPDPGMTPPKIAQRHQQLLEELKAKPRASIEITSSPTGADVVVDGAAQGKTPLVVRDLLPGTHFVGIAGEGARAEKKLTVNAGASGRVDEKIGDPRAVAARELRELLKNPATEDVILAKAKDVGDDVIIGAIAADGDTALLVVARVKSGNLLVAGARIDKKNPAKQRAAQLVDALLNAKTDWIGSPAKATPATVLASGVPKDKPVVVVGPPPPPPPSDGDSDTGTWVIVGVGAAAVALVGAVAVASIFVANSNANSLEVKVDASLLKKKP